MLSLPFSCSQTPCTGLRGLGQGSRPHLSIRGSQIVTSGPCNELALETSAHMHKGPSTSTQRKGVLAFHLTLPPKLGLHSGPPES